MLIWGGALVVLLTINLIWTGDAIQVGMFAFAAGVVFASVALLVARDRAALRAGAPDPEGETRAVPEASLGAALVGFALATLMFGFVFGTFLILFGAGLLIASLGRVVLELRAERQSARDVARRR